MDGFFVTMAVPTVANAREARVSAHHAVSPCSGDPVHLGAVERASTADYRLFRQAFREHRFPVSFPSLSRCESIWAVGGWPSQSKDGLVGILRIQCIESRMHAGGSYRKSLTSWATLAPFPQIDSMKPARNSLTQAFETIP